MADGLTEQEKRDLRFVFDVYDPKQTGLISADDVVRAMTALAFSQSRDVIEVFDIEIDNPIDMNQAFFAAIPSHKKLIGYKNVRTFDL